MVFFRKHKFSSNIQNGLHFQFMLVIMKYFWVVGDLSLWWSICQLASKCCKVHFSRVWIVEHTPYRFKWMHKLWHWYIVVVLQIFFTVNYCCYPKKYFEPLLQICLRYCVGYPLWKIFLGYCVGYPLGQVKWIGKCKSDVQVWQTWQISRPKPSILLLQFGRLLILIIVQHSLSCWSPVGKSVQTRWKGA